MLRALCLLAVLLPRLALAVCLSGGFSIWPPPAHPLPANGQLVLEGSGDSQEAVARVAERSPRPVAGEEVVALRVIAVHRGAVGLTQAVLAPEHPLRPGKRYVLGFEPPTEGRARALPSEQWVDDEQVPWAWTVIQPDVLPPQWRGVPRVVGFRHEQFGCGPVIEVDVSAIVDDEMLQCHVLAEVAPVGGGEPVRFRLTPRGRQVAIGHGMCGGAFRLEEGCATRCGWSRWTRRATKPGPRADR
ncbi:hypothetical protein ACN28S_22600 [Cystobacter fuscus]